MKSPNYILKSVYHERVQLEDFTLHQKKLKQISNIPPEKGAILKQNEVAKQIDMRHRSRQVANRFTEYEMNLARQRENKSLKERMVQLQQTKSQNLEKLLRSQQPMTSQKSLNQTGQRKEQIRITLENFNLAQRMINLPPVIKRKKLLSDFEQHQCDLNLLKRYHAPRVQEFVLQNSHEALLAQHMNLVTKEKFGRTKSCSNFAFIYPRLNKRFTLLLLDIGQTFIYSLKQSKCKPDVKYFWEVLVNEKRVLVTDTKTYEEAEQDIIDITWKKREKDILTIQLYKAKNNDVAYLGQIEISMNEIILKNQESIHRKTLSESEMMSKVIDKVVDNQHASIGTIKFKVWMLEGSQNTKKIDEEEIRPKTFEEQSKENNEDNQLQNDKEEDI